MSYRVMYLRINNCVTNIYNYDTYWMNVNESTWTLIYAGLPFLLSCVCVPWCQQTW